MELALVAAGALVLLYAGVRASIWVELRRNQRKRRLKLPRDKAPLRAVDGR